VIRFARVLGIAVQALVLGSLLAFAIAELIAATTGAVVFRYQGF